jgi:1,4-dihydroxy-2-naphthoate polyprenyltransferase
MLTKTTQGSTSSHFYYHTNGIKLIRPMTLTGTLTPILTASGLAALSGYFHFGLFIATTLTALLIQSAVNILNDYFDFAHGQDHDKWTKHEGGPYFHILPIYAVVLLIMALFLGVWIGFHTNLLVFLLGLIGVVLGVLYSAGSHSLSSLGLGEITAALSMGTIVPWSTYMIQTGRLDSSIVLVSLPFAFLIATMILTNNIRDIKKDEGFRHTLAMRISLTYAINLFTFLLLLPYGILGVLILFKIVPVNAVATAFVLPIAYRLRRGVKSYHNERNLNIMKWAAYHHWSFGIIFAGGIWIAFWLS